MNELFQWLIDIIRELKLWYIVNPWEHAVRVRCGKNATVIGPGLHPKFPILDEVYLVNTRLRFAAADLQTISSRDGKIVTVGAQIGFSIIDPLLALTAYQKPENAMAVLAHNCVAQYVLDHDSFDIDISEMEEFIVNGLKGADPTNGIQLEFVQVTNLVISSPARTIRLVTDSFHTDYSSEPGERGKEQSKVTQW